MSITQIFENLKTGWVETRQIDVNRMLAEDLRDAPQPVRAPLGGMTGTEHERVTRPPAPVPATKQLRTNLERVTLAYNDRERVLVKEIAEREAELADVRRARDATTAALMELDVDLPEIAVPDAPIGVDAATGDLVFADDLHERVNAAQVAADRLRVHARGGYSLEQIEIAGGAMLDTIGSYQAVTRKDLEPDDRYRKRILAVVQNHGQ